MVKNFKDFKAFNESNEDIHSICEKYDITNYTINDDGSIDVEGDVYLSILELIKLPLKFRNVYGSFYCNDNQLVTLKGSPRFISDDFYCNNNKLTSLKGAPESVGGNFYIRYNKLTSLEHISDFRGLLYCDNNPISKWFIKINYKNNQDIEAFIDFNIDYNDPDDINQEKIDQINNG